MKYFVVGPRVRGMITLTLLGVQPGALEYISNLIQDPAETKRPGQRRVDTTPPK